MSTVITQPRRTRFTSRAWCVLKAWVRNPTQVATVCPSSPFVTEHLANRECVFQADQIIELGPGAGCTTDALLSRMRSDARLLAIEKTSAFSEALRSIEDPRLCVEFADACDLIDVAARHDIGSADVVISGIPFSSLPAMNAKRIVQSIHHMLRPGGVFIAYQLKPDIERFARPLFGPSRSEAVPMNLPPLRVYAWNKYEK